MDPANRISAALRMVSLKTRWEADGRLGAVGVF
jgi:hypothetical protein